MRDDQRSARGRHWKRARRLAATFAFRIGRSRSQSRVKAVTAGALAISAMEISRVRAGSPKNGAGCDVDCGPCVADGGERWLPTEPVVLQGRGRGFGAPPAWNRMCVHRYTPQAGVVQAPEPPPRRTTFRMADAGTNPACCTTQECGQRQKADPAAINRRN